jgi:cytochrome b561
MALRSTALAWGGLTRLLHWGMLALFATTMPLGWSMTDLPPGAHKVRLYALHKSIGLTLLALAVLRLAWRAAERRPELPPMPRWQTRAAGATHAVLYALMFAIPLSGWLFNSAAGFPLRWFGLVNLPSLSAPNPALKSLAHGIHETAVWALLALVALHLAAALKHHFVDRDRTLALMVPGVKAPGAGRDA